MTQARSAQSELGVSFLGFMLWIALLGGGIYIWVCHLEPFLFDQKFSTANLKFEFNKFTEAKQRYEELLPKAPPHLHQAIEDRIHQIPLAEKFLANPASTNPGLDLKFIEGYIAKIGLIYVHYSIENLSNTIIPVRRSLFYIKSNVGKCEVALDRPQNTEVNSWNGDLKPGEKAVGAFCVKYQLVDPDEKLFIVYNNGNVYANSPVPISRIAGLSSLSQFTDAWKGLKFDPVKPPSPPHKTVTTPSKQSRPYRSPQQRARELQEKANERYAT